ncbi:hypothetical protein pdam_00025136, partial [Pocillopora damicornis]
MVNVQFDDNLNSFQVKEPDLPQGFEIVKQEELELPFLYHAHKFEKKLYIILKENPLGIPVENVHFLSPMSIHFTFFSNAESQSHISFIQVPRDSSHDLT